MIDKEIFAKKKIEFEKGRIFANSFDQEEATELIKIYQDELERNKKDLEDTNIIIADLKSKLGNME
jgi:hypothetical protein